MTSTAEEAPTIKLTDNPLWLIAEEGFDPAREHDVESLFTIGNGYLGTRGAVNENSPVSHPATLIAGVFDPPSGGSAIPELVVAPDWTSIRISVEGEPVELIAGHDLEHRRVLDLKQGLLHRFWRHRDRVGRITELSFTQLASFADRHTCLLQVMVTPENYSGHIRIESAIDGRVTNTGGVNHLLPLQCRPLQPSGVLYSAHTTSSGITIALAAMSRLGTTHLAEGQADSFHLHGSNDVLNESEYQIDQHMAVEYWEVDAKIGRTYSINKVVSIFTSRDTTDPVGDAVAHLNNQCEVAWSELFQRHVEAFKVRWEHADVQIIGEDQTTRAVRFAIYHLLIAASSEDEHVSIGARTLSGEAYKGHVFWDTETFMLPYFICTDPATARALLMYRYHTIAGAKHKAEKAGFRGALYAWESAESGEETTPPFVINPQGLVLPVLSGIEQHHLSADIAYAIFQYWRITGDDNFILEAGGEIVFETARFWASRAQLESDKHYHIRRVMGPDEYHESIDDNVYTNIMAQWTLRFGLQVIAWLRREYQSVFSELQAKLELADSELLQWKDIADGIFINYHKDKDLFEECQGFFDLEYIDLREFEPRSAPMDLLLGRVRTQGSQVVKQADVLLLFQLLPDQFPMATQRANFDYYEPRTGHGSSLSPSTHALVAAKLGDLARAERYLQQSAEIDLRNNMGNASGGIHAAACGGLWQALVFGFGGLTVSDTGMTFEPHLLAHWKELRFAISWRGMPVSVSLTNQPSIQIRGDGQSTFPVRLVNGEYQQLLPGVNYEAVCQGGRWQELRKTSGGDN